MNLNQIVNWKECPPSVPATTTRVRGLSPCRRFALVDWVATPVFIKDLSPSELPNYPYSPHKDNQWTSNNTDSATGKSLLEWVKEHE